MTQSGTTRSAPPDLKLGIVISMFPELHETFILRELVALEQKGVRFDIYSLQYPRDPVTLDDAIRLSTERTQYAQLISRQTLSALFLALLRHPLRVFGAVGALLRHGRDRPAELIKSLAILPISLHFGRLARQRGVTHLHGHWANVPTTACWYLGRIERFPWSAAIHGEDIFTPNRFLSHKLNDAVFTVVCSGYFCRHLRQNLSLRRPGDVHLNYHGLNPSIIELARQNKRQPTRWTSIGRSRPLRLISIGRLVRTKGHDTLIKAVARLTHEHGLTVSLDLIGSGPEEANLKALASNQQLDHTIRFMGGLPFNEVVTHLLSADIFCLAPRLIPGQPPDGIPNVIAEAMALEVPVVSTRVSAIPELVEHDITGMLVEVDNDDAFARAIVATCHQPERTAARVEAARERVSVLFNQERNIDELLALFHRYLQATPQ